MTKARKPGTKTGLLKTTIVVGSVVATMLGTNLLAHQDAQVATVDAPPIEVLLPPASWPGEVGFPQSQLVPSQFTDASENAFLTLKPIPTVASPADVALSQPLSTTQQAVVVPDLAPIPAVAAPSVAGQPGVNVADIGNILAFDLPAIPQVQIPPPVTNSRSTR